MNHNSLTSQHIAVASELQQIAVNMESWIKVGDRLTELGYTDPSERAAIVRATFLIMLTSELRLTEMMVSGSVNEPRLVTVLSQISEIVNKHLLVVYGQATGEIN